MVRSTLSYAREVLLSADNLKKRRLQINNPCPINLEGGLFAKTWYNVLMNILKNFKDHYEGYERYYVLREHNSSIIVRSYENGKTKRLNTSE